jgi:hypothetical protein
MARRNSKLPKPILQAGDHIPLAVNFDFSPVLASAKVDYRDGLSLKSGKDRQQ